MVVERDIPFFSTSFHFHPECELVYIQEGNGKRIVGDCVESFQAGDLVFLGPNVPHVWYSDEAYHRKETSLRSRAIVIYFTSEIFGANFYALNETQGLKQLFHRAERGMRITGKANKNLYELVASMPHKKNLDRITGLLQILQLLSTTKEYELLAGIGYQHSYDAKDNHKIDEVFQYVSKHFNRHISLEEMAARCNLTPQSFCRFFKKRTQKTFVDFLNEFRISHARKLLAENEDMSISEIAYICGFNNISYFIKAFKAATGITPRQHKKNVTTEV
jgi:AraC-like DNA-binding protein